jgi:hypothetical protein
MKHLAIVILLLVGTHNFAWAFENATSWRLSTDDTTMVMALQHGTPVITELSSAKTGPNWLLAPVPEILPSPVILQGAPVAINWQYDGGALDRQSGQLVLRFSNSAIYLASTAWTWADRALVDHCQSFCRNHYSRSSGQSRTQQCCHS